MHALSELFDVTTLVVPVSSAVSHISGESLTGHNLSIAPLTSPAGRRLWRKLGLLLWFVRNFPVLIREVHRADAIHAPIPGDIGTIGMLLGFVLRKPLFVRHCGNWYVQKTAAEHFWRWFIERFAGGRNVMLTTGGDCEPPSRRNPNVRWIFSTSLTERELHNSFMRRERNPGIDARLIIVCRQEKEKGTGSVIESLPFILKDFPQATLDVVGDGPALPELKRQAAALGVSDHVTFHGKENHATVIRLLQQADLFCYPTAASEGFPKAVLEALACGLPVVTTRVSVLPQLIGKGCGLVLEDATPTAIARAVGECLSNADRYQAMSLKAVEIAQEYSLERWRDTIGTRLREAWGSFQRAA